VRVRVARSTGQQRRRNIMARSCRYLA
jgi:hypothetical protein